MVIRKDDLYSLIERLPEHDQKTAFDFLQFLIDRSENDILNEEMENSYLQAQADIATDPSLREQIEKARKNFDEGRFYTTDQAIELTRLGRFTE